MPAEVNEVGSGEAHKARTLASPAGMTLKSPGPGMVFLFFTPLPETLRPLHTELWGAQEKGTMETEPSAWCRAVIKFLC